jgi:PhnB protein
MPITQITPYLYFNGRAAQAVEHYQHILGAKVEVVLKFSDIPDANPSDANKNRVAHAALRIDGQLLMLSDGMSGDPIGRDSNVYVSLDFDDETELTKRFDALAATGKTVLAIHDTFWGGKLGMLSDEFGIHWIFVTSQERK